MDMDFSYLIDTLSIEEKKEISRYIGFRRSVMSQGYRPIITSSRGRKTKVLKGGDESLVEFVNELLKPDILASIENKDPLLKAKLRGVKARKKMLEYNGQSWTTEDVAEYLGISVQAVSKKRKSRKILGLFLGAKGYVFPGWQFEQNGILPKLSTILKILEEGQVPDWDKLRFFVSGDYGLEGKTPIECLQASELELVESAAKVFGVHSAA